MPSSKRRKSPGRVTDAYRLGLAIRRGGMLATLDQRIAALTQPKSSETGAVETVG